MLTKRMFPRLTSVGVCMFAAVVTYLSAPGGVGAQESVTKKLDPSTWKLLDVDGRTGVVAFSIDGDGNVEVFTSANFVGDYGPYDMADVKMVTIAVTIGGATRVCWTTNSGQEQCEPPK